MPNPLGQGKGPPKKREIRECFTQRCSLTWISVKTFRQRVVYKGTRDTGRKTEGGSLRQQEFMSRQQRGSSKTKNGIKPASPYLQSLFFSKFTYNTLLLGAPLNFDFP